MLYYDKNNSSNYIFDETKSILKHENHKVGKKINNDLTKEMKSYINEKIIQKKVPIFWN